MSRDSQKLLQTVHTVMYELEKKKFTTFRNYGDNNMDAAIKLKKDGVTESDNVMYYTKHSYDSMKGSHASEPSMFLGIMTNMVTELYRVCNFHKLDLGNYSEGDTQVLVKVKGVDINQEVKRRMCKC